MVKFSTAACISGASTLAYSPRLVSLSSSAFTLSDFCTLRLSKIAAFLPDYPNALKRAEALDTKVQKDASAISDDYAAIVALSIRQTLGMCDITVSKDPEGNWDKSDIMVFMKGGSAFILQAFPMCFS